MNRYIIEFEDTDGPSAIEVEATNTEDAAKQAHQELGSSVEILLISPVRANSDDQWSFDESIYENGEYVPKFAELAQEMELRNLGEVLQSPPLPWGTPNDAK